MSHFLIEVGYTPQSWSTQLDSQANVIERITPALKACGGTLESAYYAFGDADFVAIVDFKDATDAAAFALAMSASGALRSYKTTQLLTVDEGIESMKKADKIRASYTPPVNVSLLDAELAKH